MISSCNIILEFINILSQTYNFQNGGREEILLKILLSDFFKKKGVLEMFQHMFFKENFENAEYKNIIKILHNSIQK